MAFEKIRERMKKSKKKNKITRREIFKRSFIVLVAMILLFTVNIGSLVYVQLIKNETFKAYAEDNQLIDRVVSARRGTIYDCNMNVLAQSASVWKIYINPFNFTQHSKKFNDYAIKCVCEKLAAILDLEKDDIKDIIVNYPSQKYMVIKRKVEKTERDKVNDLFEEYITLTSVTEDGIEKTTKECYDYFIGIESDVKRYYPDGNLASNLIGFTNDNNDGSIGLEYTYNNLLSGSDGRVIYSNTAMNANAPLDFTVEYEPKPGSNLVLTIDETIQRYLDAALEQCYKDTSCKVCYGIVMDVDTGAVLAMSSKNDYDLNNPSKLTNEEQLETAKSIEDETERQKFYENAWAEQWKNNAISDIYEPGSVFKLITLAAAIEENEVIRYSADAPVSENNTPFNCYGSIQIEDRLYYCHNHGGCGPEDYVKALANSCNPFYITMGQRLGVNRFAKYFEAFGFTEKTGIDLPVEAEPAAGTTYHKFDDMSLVNLASTSFGQSFGVSAIQMITAVNAIANGGKLMQPYVVAKTLDSENNVIKETKPIVKRQVISESTSRQVLDAMVETVKTGTAKNGYVAGYNVAGKTGTSDKLTNTGECTASFAGIAPANDPQISIIIVVDEPQGEQFGSAVAAPVAAEVIDNTLTYMNVKRDYTDGEISELNIPVPNFVGEDVSTAYSKAQESGLTIKIIGDGDTVISQCPAYGQYVPQNGIVALYTSEDSDKYMVTVPDFRTMTISQASLFAVQSGLNVKISGNSLERASLTAFRQSVEPGTEIESGSTVTLYFKSNQGITDG